MHSWQGLINYGKIPYEKVWKDFVGSLHRNCNFCETLKVKRFFLRNQINYLEGTDSNSTSVECVSRTEPDGTQKCIPKQFFLTDEIIYNSDSDTNNLTSTMAPLTTKKRVSRKEALQKTLNAVQPLGVIIGIFASNHVK